MDSKQEALLFPTSFWWLSKVNLLARAYKIKDELNLCFEGHGEQDLLSSIELKEFCLTSANFVNNFEALNDYKLDFARHEYQLYQ